jgi:hypothetical protein
MCLRTEGERGKRGERKKQLFRGERDNKPENFILFEAGSTFRDQALDVVPVIAPKNSRLLSFDQNLLKRK